MAKRGVKVTSSTTEKKVEKATAVKPAVIKPAAVKPAVKKTTKTTAKKEIKVRAVVEYYGKQVEEKDMIANVKKAWTKSGKKVGDIKTMELYIKPEEAAVYYVINGTESGAVAFWVWKKRKEHPAGQGVLFLYCSVSNCYNIRNR